MKCEFCNKDAEYIAHRTLFHSDDPYGSLNVCKKHIPKIFVVDSNGNLLSKDELQEFIHSSLDSKYLHHD